MNTNVIGRVRNIYLPKSQGLLPLFEAIINSIDAIDDSGINTNEGMIEIYIKRTPNIFNEAETPTGELLNPITGFEIVDNGIGFTDKNYDSFNEADTLNKLGKGGKGVGRFTWLKAFEKVDIESTFISGEKYNHREFTFILENPDCIKNLKLELNVNQKEGKTKVKLINYIDDYDKQIPKSSAAIAQRIVEHCLEYFVFTKMPKCIIHDDQEDENIDLDQVYDRFVAKTEQDNIKIENQAFIINHFYLHARADLKHHICYCVNNRVVTKENIGSKIRNLPSSINIDGSNEEFIYAGYVSSQFFDTHLNPTRIEFDFLPDGGIPTAGEMEKSKVDIGVLEVVEKFLQPHIEIIRKIKIKQINDYIVNEAPEYRYILRNHTDKFEDIAPGLSSEKLDVALYEIHKDIEIDLRKEGKNFLDNEGFVITNENNKEEILQKFSQWWQESNEVGKANLAKYIILRKNTIDILEKALSLDNIGKYSREEVIHQIIFPLRNSSDDIQYEEHNLWVIDERLAYHRYLASDLKLKNIKELDSDSELRPDLIFFFNRAIATVEEELPYNTGIVIFEFKRPMRNDYNDEENPIQQVFSYIKEIRSGKALTKDGRPINIQSSTPFYSYIICDFTETLKTQASFAGLRPTPDNSGYFGYNDPIGTYIELISFDKLVTDAKKRNRILFDKLNLPK